MNKSILTIFLVISVLSAIKSTTDTGSCGLEPEPSCGGTFPSEFTLSYWDSRGMGQPIRELAKYLNISFTDHRYSSPDPNLSDDLPEKIAQKESANSYWIKKEKNVAQGNYFMNLPEIEFSNENGEKETLSESEAILLWLIKKSGKIELLPQGFDEQIRYAQLNGIITDINRLLRMPCYTQKTIEELRKNLSETFINLAKYKLRGLAEILGTDQWLMGDRQTVLDFKFADLVSYAIAIEKELELQGGFSAMENGVFRGYLGEYRKIPEISQYLKESDYIFRPYNGRRALWN